ncbi:MAG: ParB N-terminal domain-containing protein [Planctomycetota bacterium]|nr:ParB N-terminal domain-containing protein [Planctomycetota bacterium]
MEHRDRKLCWLPVKELLDAEPFPPRESDPPLDFLLSSVRLHGILSPLVVREIQGRRQVVCGYRRLLAAREAGLEKVPVVLAEIEDLGAIRCYLSENMCRQTLSDDARESALKLLKELRDGDRSAAPESAVKPDVKASTEARLQAASRRIVEGMGRGESPPRPEKAPGAGRIASPPGSSWGPEERVGELIARTDQFLRTAGESRSIDMVCAGEIVEDLLGLADAGESWSPKMLYGEAPAEGWLARHSLLVASLNARLTPPPEFDERQRVTYALGGLLHDVGMVFFEEVWRNDGGSLSWEDRQDLQSHTRIGHALVSAAGPEHAEVALVARDHHERLDGSGYPGGLRGDQMGRLVRLTALVDSFASLAGERPHRGAIEPRKALERLARAAEMGLYDPRLFPPLHAACQSLAASTAVAPSGHGAVEVPARKNPLPVEFY